LLLKEISAAYFGFCQCGFSPAWQFFNNLAAGLAKLCSNGFFAAGAGSFSILRIAEFMGVKGVIPTKA
jgi:hypothetical protein